MLHQLKSIYYYYILDPLRRLKNIISWIPLLWCDQDNYYNFMITILIRKLDNMRNFFIENDQLDEYYHEHNKWRKRTYKQISEVVEHFKRYRDPHGYDAIETFIFEEVGRSKASVQTNIKRILKTDRCFPKLQADSIDSIKNWHWSEAWRKLEKYGCRWWD